MKRIIRERRLNQDEIARDQQLRSLIASERPAIDERVRGQAAAHSNPSAEAPQPPPPKKQRVDGQLTALAGEFFVAAELLKRGLQTSITFGNAKSIDLLAVNTKTRRTFTVQVKSLRKRNFFPISHDRVQREHVYVFAVLNKPGQSVQYFIVPGTILADHPGRFGKWFVDPKFPGIDPTALREFADAWHTFDEPTMSDCASHT